MARLQTRTNVAGVFVVPADELSGSVGRTITGSYTEVCEAAKVIARGSGKARERSGSVSDRSKTIHRYAIGVTVGGDAEERAMAVTIIGEAAKVLATARDRKQLAVDAMTDLLVPTVPSPTTFLSRARMIAETHADILNSGDWVKASQIAEASGTGAANSSALPNRWKRESRIFAINHKGVDLYPAYALDLANGCRPLPAVADVLAVLAPIKDDWKLAAWFHFANGYLGGESPKALLAQAPERVIAAAHAETTRVAHV